MGITPDFNNGDINEFLRRESERIEKLIVKNLQRIGEKFLIACKTQPVPSVSRSRDGRGMLFMGPKEPVYADQSGNLRASYGYFILKNGSVLFGNFGDSGKPEGTSAAKEALDMVEKKSGYQLIGVAGMGYAAYVESKGYNVMTTQSLLVIDDLKQFVKRLNSKNAGLNLGVE